MLGRMIDIQIQKEREERESIINNTEKVLNIVEKYINKEDMEKIVDDLVEEHLLWGDNVERI